MCQQQKESHMRNLNNLLIQAVRTGDLTSAKELINKGANPKSVDYLVLYLAFNDGHKAVVEYIEQVNADYYSELSKLGPQFIGSNEEAIKILLSGIN
jgi:ankyrin repeat protein